MTDISIPCSAKIVVKWDIVNICTSIQVFRDDKTTTNVPDEPYDNL